jgi:hypothetical protein
MFEQSSQTVGFQEMRSAFDIVPNISTIKSQLSPCVVLYHAWQSLGIPVSTGDGLAVTVGGIGSASDAKLATQ